MRRAGRLLVLPLLLAAAATGQTHSGLSYSSADPAHKLDIYMPTGGTAPYPVIVWIHGGAWMTGNRNDPDARQLSTMLGGRGFAVVSIGYRFSGTAKWPAQIHDCKGAIRWIRANAAKYQFNPDAIAAAGMSAGGHLAAMLGTSGGVGAHTVGSATVDLEGTVGGNVSHSSRVQAVLDLYGPTDLLAMGEACPANNPAVSPLDHAGAGSPESQLLGAPVQTVADRAATANPITFVTADDPPFKLLHGTRDELVVVCQGIALETALKRANAQNRKESTLHRLDQGHGFSVTVMRDTVIAFFVRNLASAPTSLRPASPPAAARPIRPWPHLLGRLLPLSHPE